jgi:cation diffusion facilitator family transporter
MLSQSLQGLSDLVTAIILLFGVSRSARSHDKRHQFGYGREIFFWVLIAGMFMFIGTGVISIAIGYNQLKDPSGIENIGLAIVMLMFGFTTNAYSFSRSVRRLNQTIGTEKWWKRFMHSGMVETKATFLIDFLGTITALFGLVAIGAYILTGNERFDGIGSIAIGLGMMIGSFILIRDVKGLIIGRSVSDSIAEHINQSAIKVDGVQSVLDLRTMYLGSSKLLVLIEVHLADNLSTDEIEVITDKIKDVIIQDVPHAYHVQVEVETPD